MRRRRTYGCAIVALTCLLAVGASGVTAHAAKPRKTIARELTKLYQRGAIAQATYDADRAILADVKSTIRRLSGARKIELAGVLATVERMAARGSLRATRLHPLFLTLARNREWWSAQPLLTAGQRVTFEDSELVWQYVPGQGLQLHPLANFGKLNAYAKSRRRVIENTQLLDELMAVAVPRGGGLAWEYYFDFGGGKPPWVSSLSQGTALQAVARSAAKLGRMAELLPAIQRGLTLFEQAPPTGVRLATDQGAHYVQYSFWPRLRIINGFVQSLVGLYDVAQITGDARAAQLFADGDRAARVEVPAFDTGAWSYYSRDAITRESDLHYHTLLRDFVSSLCDRTAEPVYCTAESHFTSYLTIPPALELRTTRVRGGTRTVLRFSLSKISSATVRVTAPDGRTVLSAAAGVVGRGTRSVTWNVPRKAGRYTAYVDATDLAGNAATAEAPVEVIAPKRRKPAAK
jgi:D-glucuronyl C5-epimerase C-terminus/Bacterial Ig-like domain